LDLAATNGRWDDSTLRCRGGLLKAMNLVHEDGTLGLKSSELSSKDVDLILDLLKVDWIWIVSWSVGHCRSGRASSRESQGTAKRLNHRNNVRDKDLDSNSCVLHAVS
jgi:hypothetical protein